MSKMDLLRNHSHCDSLWVDRSHPGSSGCVPSGSLGEICSQKMTVYAFYHQNPKLRIILIMWFSVEVAGSAHYLWYISTHVDFDPACAMIHLPLIGKIYRYI